MTGRRRIAFRGTGRPGAELTEHDYTRRETVASADNIAAKVEAAKTEARRRAGLIPRQPQAFGITKWGPLPGSEDTWIMWDGPGSPLWLYARDPEVPGTGPGLIIRHSSAAGTFQTVKQAEKAVRAFVLAGIEDPQ